MGGCRLTVPAVRITEAATALNKSPATVRRWIRRGAPCARPGEPGRGRGALVVVADLHRWRLGAESTSAAMLDRLAGELRAYHRSERHRIVAIPDAHAAALYVDLFEFVARRIGIDAMPEDIKLLAALAGETARE